MTKTSFAGLLAFLALGAAAQTTTDPKVVIDVSSVGTQVTISASGGQDTPDKTYSAYIVSFVNGGGSEVRQTVFTLTARAETNPPLGLTTPLIQPQSVNPDLPARCTLPDGQPIPAAGAATVRCNYADLVFPPDYALPPFPVIVSAPRFTGNPVSGAIFLKAEGAFREGKSQTASLNSVGYSSDEDFHTVTQLAPDSVDSVVVKGGGTLFTGAKGKPTTFDRQSTEVTFQALTSVNYDLVNITETPVADAYATTCLGDGYFKTCYETTLTAEKVNYVDPSTGLVLGYLTEVIRVHKDNLAKPVSQMSKVIWYYTSPKFTAEPILSCTSPTTPTGTGMPCQTQPVACYDAKNNPPPPGEAINTCVWRFINTENGLIRPLF